MFSVQCNNLNPFKCLNQLHTPNQIIRIDHSKCVKYFRNVFGLGSNLKSKQMQVEFMFWLLRVNHMFIEMLLCFVGGKENLVLPPH